VSLFKNKIVWIFSQQNWNGLKVSKHHYAETLADAGAKIYYFNPPQDSGWKIKKAKLSINNFSNVNIVSQQFYFPINLKFHFRFLYNQLIKIQLKILRKNLPSPDFVWSFDLSNNFPLFNFGNSFNIFHPVDEPLNKTALNAYKGTHLILSVTEEILSKYPDNLPKHLINHGLHNSFVKNYAPKDFNRRISVGMSGNWLRQDLDRNIIKEIIINHSNINFECWGNMEYDEKTTDSETIEFIQFLTNQFNVKLHGIVNAKELAIAYQQMDAFLICYDIQKDQSKGTNYHKVIEFLSTGRVVISNNISYYDTKPNLLEMSKSRIGNIELPIIFNKVINEISLYNTTSKCEFRRNFALGNSYEKQLAKIEKLISNIKK